MAAVYPSDSEDGEIEVAIVIFGASLIDVVKGVSKTVAVVLDVSRVSGVSDVLFMLLVFSILIKDNDLFHFYKERKYFLYNFFVCN